VKKASQNLLVLLLVYLVLALTGLLAFAPLRHNDFVAYDDRAYVARNPQVQAGLTRASVAWAFRASDATNWHPLTWLSHMLDCQLFGLDPRGHHLTSLLLHLANTLLLFALLHLATGAVWRSAFVAAAFALHPLRVESVAWVAERKDILSGLFWMTTLIAYAYYTRRPNLPRFLLVFVSLGLGLMAKPMLVTLPFVLLLLDYWPLGRFPARLARQNSARPTSGGAPAPRSWPTALRLLAEKLPLLVLAAASGVITFLVQQKGGAMMPGDYVPFSFRPANALIAYVRYLAKLVYPRDLAVLYPYRLSGWPAWQTIAAVLLLLALTVVVLYLAPRRRYLAVGWLWFLGTLVPVLGLVQVGHQSIADRYTYLPSIGLLIIVAWGLPDLLARWRYGRVVLALFGTAVLALLLSATRVQVTYWQDSLTLYGHALAVTRDNYVMQSNYGGILLQEGRLAEATTHFRAALRINPRHALAWGNLGQALLAQGQTEEAIACFTRLLQDPAERVVNAYASLGLAYTLVGKYDLAIRNFTEALRIDPQSVPARQNLGVVLLQQGRAEEAVACFTPLLQDPAERPRVCANLGAAYAQLRQYDLAWQNLTEALRLDPKSSVARKNLGLLLLEQGRAEEAIAWLTPLLQEPAERPRTYANLGSAYAQLGQDDLARQHYAQALRLDPNNPSLLYHVALLLKKRGQIDQAIDQWHSVLRLAPDFPGARHNLGVTLAQKGDYYQALPHLRAACAADPNALDALDSLAWILAVAPDQNLHRPAEALPLAQRACELTGYRKPETLDTLAAVYAALGQFPAAVETAQKARQLAQDAGQEQLARDIRSRGELYRSGQPYYEPPSLLPSTAPPR